MPALDDEARMVELRGDALPVRMAVAFPQFALDEPGEHAGHVEWNGAAVQQAVVAAIETVGLVESVRRLSSQFETTEARLDAAWAAGDDLLLEVTVRQARAGYVEANGL
jgi:hypothetical protein